MLRRWLGTGRDRSVDLSRFNYASELPKEVIKVAESGVSAGNCAEVFALGFHAILVGTSLLMDGRGVTAALHDFEIAMERGKSTKFQAPSSREASNFKLQTSTTELKPD